VIIIATILLISLVSAEDYVHSPIQYQSQTDGGTYNFGYDTGLFGSHQFHQEYKDDSGQVRGRYGYTDPFGKLRLVHYTSGPQGYEVVSDTEADKTPKTSGWLKKILRNFYLFISMIPIMSEINYER